MVNVHCEACGKKVKSISDLRSLKKDDDIDELKKKFNNSNLSNPLKICRKCRYTVSSPKTFAKNENVADGTYIYTQKSSNYRFQRRSFSIHKGRPLVKLMILVSTTGYILLSYKRISTHVS